MTLTVVVGSSGSGKTTFLNDVHTLNKCTYVRQYHNLRPYVPVSKIPNFDPTKLPFWNLYSDEKSDSYNPNILVGGTMAGEFTAGLSGGQRKLLLFELVKQRTCKDGSADLLIALDEPFAGVTDDFVPFIVENLNLMRETHNILLVTNDHVKTLTDLADNTITVSAIDRSTVTVNEMTAVDRELAMHAVASGVDFDHAINDDADLKFFWSTEIVNNPNIGGVAGFTVFAMSIFLMSYWDSKEGSEALVLVAIQIIAYFCLNPYLLSLVDWRNFTTEEAEALLHSSVGLYKGLKSCVVLVLLTTIAAISYGVVQLSLDKGGLRGGEYFVSMLFDSASLTLPFICFGLYTALPLEAVQILASLPFLFMIFFSTTFTPGGGVPGVKALRYLFARFYLWCRVPFVEDEMEGCPSSGGMLTFWTVFTGLLGFILFSIFLVVSSLLAKKHQSADHAKRAAVEAREEFQALQREIFRNKKNAAAAAAGSGAAVAGSELELAGAGGKEGV